MTHAATAMPMTANAESWPIALSAPATISVGMAGSGNPARSARTLAKISASPYWAISSATAILYSVISVQCCPPA